MLVRFLRKQWLRFITFFALIAPTVGTRVLLNKMKGVQLGDSAWIGGFVFLDIHHSHPDRKNSLVLGSHVAIGNYASIYTHDSLYNQVTEGRDPVEFGQVVVGDYVNISPNTFIYNSTIGHHSIVAPLSMVVNSHFPPYSLIAGNPAKVVKDLQTHIEGQAAPDDA